MRLLLLLAAFAAPARPQSAPDAMRAAIEQQQAAIARQRQAVQKQAQNLGLWLHPDARDAGPMSGGSPADPCQSTDIKELAPIIEDAAKAQGISRDLLYAVIEKESGYRPCAVSPKGAQGLMQLMPATAEQLGVEEPFDPRQNIEGGAKYLKQLLDKYQGDLKQALGAYNAGPATVDQVHGIPNIPETKDYVEAILRKLDAKTVEPRDMQTPRPIEN